MVVAIGECYRRFLLTKRSNAIGLITSHLVLASIDTSSGHREESLFFATVVHADVVVGLACPLRVSFNAGVMVVAT